MNCFHLSLLPVCVRVSFSAGAGGTIPRCDLHSDMRWIFHFFQRAEETIFLRNGRENLHQQQSTDHLAGAAHVGKGFGFFPHSKQLMGQSTGDLENRRQKNSANLSELPRPVSLGWKSLGNRFCQESPVFSGSPSAQDTGTRKQPLGTSALGLAIVSRSWKKMGSKPRCFQTEAHLVPSALVRASREHTNILPVTLVPAGAIGCVLARGEYHFWCWPYVSVVL